MSSKSQDEETYSPIQFLKSSRLVEEQLKLTPEYVIHKFQNERKFVQIMLDNCSIQCMEHMYIKVDGEGRNANEQDVYDFGLGPLLQLLKVPFVALSATGLVEMPGSKVSKALQSYLRFCDQFWPGHLDDPQASTSSRERCESEQRVNFNELPDDFRLANGVAYVPFMQYQYIYRCLSHLSPEKKFEAYLFGMIHHMDIISAFELEVMKYLFWDPKRSIQKFPQSVQKRKKLIKENFGKAGSKNIEQCRYIAFDRTMDSMWLKMSALADDFSKEAALADGVQVEIWLGTNDIKLYELCQDIHSVKTHESSMGMLCVDREDELKKDDYWRHVDALSQSVLLSRRRKGALDPEEQLPMIDKALSQIEKELKAHFETKR
ncbi:hypothetical protein [Vibrio coralliilyticus]|uniref:hypothetical protein n=1 Tax=Vibrio coralliilyticus TaxID=190893 RepID=UPI00155F83F9|nr:hypothetical protein [Vibrio coralliilyticus]NRF60934.1 hypothetical protein [Vibrio coralliilyticus]